MDPLPKQSKPTNPVSSSLTSGLERANFFGGGRATRNPSPSLSTTTTWWPLSAPAGFAQGLPLLATKPAWNPSCTPNSTFSSCSMWTFRAPVQIMTLGASVFLGLPATVPSLKCTTSDCGTARYRRPACASSALPIMRESASSVTFIREHLRELAPYHPIEPFEILSKRLGRSPKDIVKLDANENPYGPPPEVMEALGKMEFPNIYPDPESRRLRAALAEDSGLGAEHILAGCGADELIDLIMRCVLDPGDTILDFPPTFAMYAFDAAVNGANVIKVLRLKDFSLDIPRILEAVKQHSPKIIFVTSPNNPDGSLITEQHLLELLKQPVLVVLDEAYIEFSNEPSRMTWVKKFDNFIVLRTFSKRAGLAGIRVGYGAFPLNIIEYLWRAKQPYNVSVAAEVAACAALQNPKYLEDVKVALVHQRERLFKLLQDVPFLTPYPSNSNFVLCALRSSERSAEQLKADLAKDGVMVRHYNNKELKNFIRISVGKPEQIDALFVALENLRSEYS